jgi:hypothetical protein
MHTHLASLLAASLSGVAFAGSPFISLQFLGRSTAGGYDVSAAEIAAFDPATSRAFVVNALTASIDIMDLSVPAAPIRVGTIPMLPYGAELQSVAVRNGLVAAAVSATNKTDPGKVIFHTTSGAFVGLVTVGALPDMVCFTPDGTKVLSANEGVPDTNYAVDPEGSISIIDVTGPISQASVTTVGFNGLPAGVIDASIRTFGPNSPTIGQDLEPEYIAVSADSSTAWVTLQEHSAVAVVDIAARAIVAVRPLGYKAHGSGTASLTTAALTAPPVIGTTAAGQDILLGGFSGLWLDSIDATTGVITFLAHPDRGPNCEPVNVDGDAALERPFVLPAYQPRICTFTYNPATNALALTGQLLLRKPDGSPLSGLPNVLGQSAGLANTDEDPCDLFGNPLALDPLGADLEGLVRTSDGSFWMCDEYRPSLYRFDATGRMLERFVPVGANAYGATLGTEAFPAVYAQRRENRGFEAIAVWDDMLFCFVQSPLDNPDVTNDANSKASRLVRIAKFNSVTRTVVAEYAYVLEGGASDKLGDACASGPGRFLVVERDSAVGASSQKRIYEIDLAGATDLSTLSPAIAGPGGTLDRMTPAELAAAGIVPVRKTLKVDLAAVGYAAVGDKVEGLAMRDPSTLFVLNDNDFQLQGTFDRTTGLLTPNPAPASTVLGMITFSGNGLDPSDQDTVNSIRGWPVDGAYMPDAIAAFRSNGQDYYVTANEGDAREWGSFIDGTTVSAVTLDKHVFPGRSWLRGNARLGRLQIRKDLGDLDGDGDVDRIVSYGGRSFTIWAADGSRVWDSGDLLEQVTAATYPLYFNASHTNNTRDNRSRSKGPEPEGVTIGVVGGRQYIFGVAERIGGLFAFCVDDPTSPTFEGYLNSRNFAALPSSGNAGDLGSEGVCFVPAAHSPNGQPLVLVANEVSGTLSVFQVNAVCDALGDLNADCVVNGIDLAQLLGAWGSCPAPCPADLDANGTVDGADLARLLANWG